MARSKQQTFKNKADRLFSQIVRSRGFCERCGTSDNLQTSHVFSRRYAWTRTDLSNALCLCAGCHRYWHANPTESYQIAVEVIGVDEYERVLARKNRRERFDWEGEFQRLSELWLETVE